MTVELVDARPSRSVLRILALACAGFGILVFLTLFFGGSRANATEVGSDSLLDQIGSGITQPVVALVTDTVTGTTTSVVEPVAAKVDEIVAATPVVSQVIPARAVTDTTKPVIAIVDQLVAVPSQLPSMPVLDQAVSTVAPQPVASTTTMAITIEKSVTDAAAPAAQSLSVAHHATTATVDAVNTQPLVVATDVVNSTSTPSHQAPLGTAGAASAGVAASVPADLGYLLSALPMASTRTTESDAVRLLVAPCFEFDTSPD